MYATLDLWLSSLRSLPGEMDETDALRSKRCNEDAISLAPSTTESIIVEGEFHLPTRGIETLKDILAVCRVVVLYGCLFYACVKLS